jgi:nitroimidazol reductase NimA-like FMN-containing flavoprotein (pyridoxamine 5'-phosphate oxidase superfamily)
MSSRRSRKARTRPARVKRAYALFLARARVVRVATADPSGRPHVVPVCAVFDSDRLWFATGKTGRKVSNLRANARCTVVADDYTEAWDALRGVMVEGTATIHVRNPRFRRVRRLLYAKYPQYPTDAALGETDSAVVEVVPTHVFAWGFE